MLPNLIYSRSLQKWVVADGETGEATYFPAGRAGKRAAYQAAIYAHNPRLFRLIKQLIKRHPILAARAWRAAALVVTEQVQPWDLGDALATVAGNSEYGDYLIQSDNGVLTCDCEDYSIGTAPQVGWQRLCKHILAYQLVTRLNKRRCYHCRKLVDAELMTCPQCGREVTPF